MMILPRKFVDIEMPGAVGMKGEYRLRVIRHDGTVRQDTDWFPNIILDAGLNRWGTGGIISGAAIGTGASTPTAAQTQLEFQTVFTTTQGTGHDVRTTQGSAPYYASYTAVYRTAVGALSGNYSEVGVGWGSNLLFSRALILNNVGAPTSVSVASTEQLDISYRLRLYPPTADTSSIAVIGGVSYTVTGRAANVTSTNVFGGWYLNNTSAIAFNVNSSGGTASSGPIGIITAAPSGSSNISFNGTPVNAAYINNSMQRLATTTAALTDANVVGGIRAFVASWLSASFQYEFSPVIPKDSTKTLALTFSVNWGRRP